MFKERLTKAQRAKKLFRELVYRASGLFMIKRQLSSSKEPGYMIKKLSDEERELLSHLKSEDVKDDFIEPTNETFWHFKDFKLKR